MIQEEPIENFCFKLRRKFDSYEEAICHETKILQRLKAVSNPKMLNQAISSPKRPTKDSDSEQQRRKSISESMKKLWNNPEYRQAHPFSHFSKEEQSRRGKLGSLKKAEKYLTGELVKKDPKPPTYKDITVYKNQLQKTIKSNQVPAYIKCGWSRTPIN